MPGRRKKTVENGVGGDAAAVERKVKEEEEEQVVSNGSGEGEGSVDLTWEWQADGGVWTPFSKADVTQINNALQRGQQEVTMTANNKVKFTVRFARMVQKNKTTGWERAIRCAVVDADDNAGKLTKDQIKAGYQALKNVDKLIRKGQTTGSAIVQACNDFYTRIPHDFGMRQPPIIRTQEILKAKLSLLEVNPPVPKKAKSSKMADRVKKEEAGDVEESKLKTVVIKGKAPMDAECTEKLGKAHVYYESNDVYDAMLNQTNLQANNNKYYLMQLLEDDSQRSYSVWFRWGRVGKKGQSALVPCGPDLREAKDVFTRKFTDKTKNEWSERRSFVKVAGKYDLLKMDYSSGSVEKEAESAAAKRKGAPPRKEVASRLDEKLRVLVELICDVRAMAQTDTRSQETHAIHRVKSEGTSEVSFIGRCSFYRRFSHPVTGYMFGKGIYFADISSKSANYCYANRTHDEGVLVLCEVALGECNELLVADYEADKLPEGKHSVKGLGSVAPDPKDNCLTEEGVTVPTGFVLVIVVVGIVTVVIVVVLIIIMVIRVVAIVVKVIALADIEVAIRNLQKSADDALHPADQKYRSLSCGLTILKPTSDEYSLIKRYLLNTHAPTHSLYRMRLLDVFEVNKDEEAENMKPDVGNR
ncbi:PREDICTED: poly [ADP-ribose] polymerase 2-like [Priapulus caudatus]|uniref:Poly [ADP-ribose] polymerase n=1 Tax=Priapulus caudatus TaxID=37621 RepID=A0ABM1EG45_PRICU|nr:PREDICTED: poly [ADP-ribose] polymerase 2-like [Priapulus caudatus]